MKEINEFRFLHRFNLCTHPTFLMSKPEAGMWLS